VPPKIPGTVTRLDRGFARAGDNAPGFFDCPTRPANGELRINIPFEFGTDLHGAIIRHQPRNAQISIEEVVVCRFDLVSWN